MATEPKKSKATLSLSTGEGSCLKGPRMEGGAAREQTQGRSVFLPTLCRPASEPACHILQTSS